MLRLRGVSKRFGAVRALSDVDLDIPAGQVTALAGDNGAGKSVLIKCIAGIHAPDAGHMWWDGTPVHIRSPRDAAALGIETVYQDLALCDNLDIVQNMFLGRERVDGISLDEESMETAARETLSSLAVTTVRSIRQPVVSLSGGQRQSVAIAKAVLWNTKLVIMDEPTAALGVAQTAMVLDLVRRLADRGHAVVIVSHNMNDVFEVADRIAVLHLGKMVAVRTVRVVGATSSAEPRIRDALEAAGRGMTTLHVRDQDLRRAVAGFPSVAGLRVRTDFPHGLIVEVLERHPVAVFASGDRLVAATGSGLQSLIGTTLFPILGAMPNVRDSAKTQFKPGVASETQEQPNLQAGGLTGNPFAGPTLPPLSLTPSLADATPKEVRTAAKAYGLLRDQVAPLVDAAGGGG